MKCAAALAKLSGKSRFRITQRASPELNLAARKKCFSRSRRRSDGLGLGDKPRRLVTPGASELLRLANPWRRSANFLWIDGQALIATCFSQQSRNWQVVIARLRRADRANQPNRCTWCRRIPTTRSAYECARKLECGHPIIEQVYTMIYEGKNRPKLWKIIEADQKAESL